MELDRRGFLKLGALAAGAVLGPRFVFGRSDAPPADTVVVIFLRGGLDPLQAVPPYGDADYRRLRPTIAVPEPGTAGGALALDGMFGLHPSLAPLLPIYQSGQLAVVHATGLKHDERSHFACQDHLESGILAMGGGHAAHAGWLNRHLMACGDPGGFQAVGIGNAMPASLRGDARALAMASLGSFAFSSNSSRRAALEDRLYALYGRDNAVGFASRGALDATDYLAAIDPGALPVEGGAIYPTGSFGTGLKEIAQMVKARMGLRIACVDLGNFDHHDAIQAELPPLLDELAAGLAAFHADLGARMANVSLVTMTEFGRRAAENASGGTDHGCGSMMLLMGGGVLGGRVYADWPGLGSGQLFNGDLDVTLDYRLVLAELVRKRLGGDLDGSLFPDVAGQPLPGCFSAVRSQPETRVRTPRGTSSVLAP
jgi:uncharacterized protein (DUF1501 family)